MKEFIEKLIGRLRGQIRIVREYEHSAQYEPKETEVIDYEDIVEIVNQLAEEYINTSTEYINCSTNSWIPCSERLPEVLQWVLIQTTQGNMDVVRYIGESECWGNDFYHRIHPRMVIAWQPLPKPYQTKGE